MILYHNPPFSLSLSLADSAKVAEEVALARLQRCASHSVLASRTSLRALRLCIRSSGTFGDLAALSLSISLSASHPLSLYLPFSPFLRRVLGG